MPPHIDAMMRCRLLLPATEWFFASATRAHAAATLDAAAITLPKFH